jgi:ABC-type dipeptide/oligopeptide/nickel transport system ATPase subunit
MSDVLGAVESALKPHLDEDTCDYIASLLEEDPTDEDAREAVTALIEGFDSDNAAGLMDNPTLCRAFFELLDLGSSSTAAATVDKKQVAIAPLQLRKLDQAVTLSTMDVQTFASGLRADADAAAIADDEGESKIAAFYANMIDVSSAAQSERARRKARQKEIRERLEEEERQRAIQEAMDMFENNKEQGGAAADDVDTMMEASADNAQDCHFRSFDLANLRGGGPNLLTNASLSLSRGRRYGLMGRNGCGKTTFLTYVAARQLAGAVPKKMNMLLVRQEIMGNDWSAVETVVKSDVKRESVKRFISYCETELENLEQGDSSGTPSEKEQNGSDGEPEETSKAKQNMRERKRNNLKKAARDKVAATSTKSSSKKEASKEVKQAHLNEKLALAYQRLAEIEEEEGGDPEPRARKVLAGLGFSEEMQNKPTQELSGGWRMRVSLSCALFANPSLLLLDERKNQCCEWFLCLSSIFLITRPCHSAVAFSHASHYSDKSLGSRSCSMAGTVSDYQVCRHARGCLARPALSERSCNRCSALSQIKAHNIQGRHFGI